MGLSTRFVKMFKFSLSWVRIELDLVRLDIY